MRSRWAKALGVVGAVLLVVFCTSAQADIITGLQNYYNFDDPLNPGKDSSGNNRDATLSGASLVWDPIRGGVLNVAVGQYAYASVPHLGASGEGFTIALWANLNAPLEGNRGLFQMQWGGPPPSMVSKPIAGWVGSNTPIYSTIWGRVIDTVGTKDLPNTGLPELTTGQWVHIVYRGDGSNYQRFVNGMPFGPSVSYNGNIISHNTLIIGCQGTESAVGRLDDFRVYNRALSNGDILELFRATATPDVYQLRVDFGRGDTGPNGPLQPGFYTFEAPGSTTSAQIREFISPLGQDGLVKVTIDGTTHYRDYPAITGGPFVSLSPLLSDMALRNAFGTMQLTLEYLKPGEYNMTTYHHSTAFGGGTIDIYLTDLAGRRLIADDLPVTHGTNPTSISSLTFTIRTAGGPVVLEFIGGSGTQHVSLNGFEVWVPEPASSTLALVSLAGLGIGLIVRRWKQSRA